MAWQSGVMADRYHHGDLRRQLLARAGELLENDGPETVTMRGLARSLGVSHAAPGYHFADRDALLLELAAEGHEMLAAAMVDRLRDAPADGRVLAIGEGYLDFALGNPNRFRLMFAGIADMDPGASEAFAAAAQRSFETLLTVTSASPDPGVNPAAWLSAWALVHGLATLWVDGTVQNGFDQDDGAATYRSLATTILTKHNAAAGSWAP
jgi:AcrR family transcriptional regulator